MDRVKTYIKDLDKALNGGLPKDTLTLVAGTAGTGKTTLAMQYLFSGAVVEDKPALLFTLNEQEIKLIENFKQFTFFSEGLLRSSKVVIIDLRIAFPDASGKQAFYPEQLLNFFYEQIDLYKPERIVIDSITAVCGRLDDALSIRKFLFQLGNMLLLKKCSALILSEVEPGVRKYSNFGIEEFMCDGIIYLSHMDKNNRLRKTLQVVKMRGTTHSEEQFMMGITEEGIHLLKLMDT
jgi:circadian clock protein KaiC